jgi:subtilisin-like proprotein convertase family protein
LPNRSGKVTISVTVTDDAGLTTTKSFDLNILPQPDPLVAPAGVTLTTSPPFTDETPTLIAANAVTTSTPITVSGLAPYLYDADVTININHPANSQLNVVLISPQGTRVTLTSGNGGSFADVFAGSTFDDQIVSAPVSDYGFQNGVAAAYLVPEGAMAQLRGENPNGDWTLEITTTGSDTGTLNSWSLSLTTIPAAPQVQIFSGISEPLTPFSIPDDGTPLFLPLAFNGLDPYTWDVNVNVNIAHASPGDLDISLISPSGTEILLTSGNGGSNDNVFGDATFDDQAAGGIPVTDAAFTNLTSIGSVIPEAALAGFLGENPNGVWRLKVVDHTTNTEVGSVISWGLDITTVFLNDPPTVGAIINPGAIQEDSGQVTISLNSISAGGGETQPLKVTATSSNPALLPDPVVTYTSPLNSATLTYQPAPNAFGVVVVSVRVEDGGFDQNLATISDNAFTIKTFTVVINPVNDAPTIDPVVVNNVPNNPVDEDFGTLDVQLTGISAGGGEDQKLQLTAVSSQLEVISNPIIEYVQGSSTAIMHIKSNPDFNGVVQFTVKVMDGGLDNDLLTLGDNLTTTRTFQLTVVPVNDPPTITPIADPAPVNEDAPTQSLLLTNLSAGGREVQPLSVTATSSDLSVISDAFVDFHPGNSTATLSFRPAPNGYGTSTITVTVEDGGLDGNLATKGDNLTKTITFDVTVNQVNDPPVFGTLGDVLLLDEDAPEQVKNLTGVSAGPWKISPSSSRSGALTRR